MGIRKSTNEYECTRAEQTRASSLKLTIPTVVTEKVSRSQKQALKDIGTIRVVVLRCHEDVSSSGQNRWLPDAEQIDPCQQDKDWRAGYEREKPHSGTQFKHGPPDITLNPNSMYIALEESVQDIPEKLAEMKLISHHTRTGRASLYLHSTARPRYMDTMEIPWATFLFRYRSEGERSWSSSCQDDPEYPYCLRE